MGKIKTSAFQMFDSLAFKISQALILILILVVVQTLSDELNHFSRQSMSRNDMEKIAGCCLKFRQEKCIESGIKSGKVVWGHLHEICVVDGQVDEEIINAYKNEQKKRYFNNDLSKIASCMFSPKNRQSLQVQQNQSIRSSSECVVHQKIPRVRY